MLIFLNRLFIYIYGAIANSMENLPEGIYWLFGGTTILSLGLLYSLLVKSSTPAKSIVGIVTLVCLWLAAQAIISIQGVYFSHLEVIPPYLILLGVIPNALLILALFVIPSTRRWIEKLNMESLTMIHTIRMPVEIILLLLSLCHVVPTSMTFEGVNYDILAGMSAPLVANWQRREKKHMKKLLVAWNVICLILLINVIRMGILSSPTPLQTMNFDHPNIALLYFPYSWLPTFIVPLVLFSHFAALWNLRE